VRKPAVYLSILRLPSRPYRRDAYRMHIPAASASVCRLPLRHATHARSLPSQDELLRRDLIQVGESVRLPVYPLFQATSPLALPRSLPRSLAPSLAPSQEPPYPVTAVHFYRSIAHKDKCCAASVDCRRLPQAVVTDDGELNWQYTVWSPALIDLLRCMAHSCDAAAGIGCVD
jgi:hypothetical protein